MAYTSNMIPSRMCRYPFANGYQTQNRQHLVWDHHQLPFIPYHNMAAAAPNPDEMEEFQRLSDRYQPDLEVSQIIWSPWV
jgi:hypothetical protein